MSDFSAFLSDFSPTSAVFWTFLPEKRENSVFWGTESSFIGALCEL
jgi:hypothetical protein